MTTDEKLRIALEALNSIAFTVPTSLESPASTELWVAKARDSIRIARQAIRDIKLSRGKK